MSKANKFLGKTIIAMFIIALLAWIGGSGFHAFIYLLIGGGIFGWRQTMRVQPAKTAVEEAQKLYNTEINQVEYIDGKKGFPEKFYNYSDTYRLYNLVEEGRALTLQEAYNLLETQQFQENQLSIQEETRALQQDIATSVRVTAVSSAITAYNTSKMSRR
ncbi:hypothetical protein SCODD09_01390 [Streptococcus constellatus]|nr:hypothetical protein SCODD09_01390 [Streptococcus constellatus]